VSIRQVSLRVALAGMVFWPSAAAAPAATAVDAAAIRQSAN